MEKGENGVPKAVGFNKRDMAEQQKHFTSHVNHN